MTNSDEVPVKKWAKFFINKDIINIQAWSGYRMKTLDFDQKNDFLPVDASNEEIGKHLREALSLSRFVHPIENKELSLYLKDQKRYREWLESTIEKFRYKNKTQLLKGMLMVGLTLQDNKITVEPYHQRVIDGWDKEGFTEADNVIVPENCTDKELGAAARLALSRCTSKFIKK